MSKTRKRKAWKRVELKYYKNERALTAKYRKGNITVEIYAKKITGRPVWYLVMRDKHGRLLYRNDWGPARTYKELLKSIKTYLLPRAWDVLHRGR